MSNSLTNTRPEPSELSLEPDEAPRTRSLPSSVEEGGAVAEYVTFARYHEAIKRRRRTTWILAGIAALLPLVVTAVFVFFVASPMYSAESRFAVRGGQTSTQGTVSGLLATGSPSTGIGGFVDGYAVRDFLQSRDAMDQLDAKIDLASLLTRTKADPLVRLPKNPDRDDLFNAYSSLVSSRYNMIEQIVVLDVTAFTPEDSVLISKALLDITDGFADKMNARAVDDALKVSLAQLDAAEKKAIEARAAVTRWRTENSNVDPAGDVAMLNGLISQLEGQLATAQVNLEQLQALGDPNHPRLRSAEMTVASIQQKIAETRRRLGGGGANAATLISGYEGLKAAQDFAEQNLASTRQSLEQARVTALSQQRYLSIIAQPEAQLRPTYPATLIMLGGALLVGLALAFFGSLVVGLFNSLLPH